MLQCSRINMFSTKQSSSSQKDVLTLLIVVGVFTIRVVYGRLNVDHFMTSVSRYLYDCGTEWIWWVIG